MRANTIALTRAAPACRSACAAACRVAPVVITSSTSKDVRLFDLANVLGMDCESPSQVAQALFAREPVLVGRFQQAHQCIASRRLLARG